MENKRQSTKGIEKKFEVIRVFVAVSCSGYRVCLDLHCKQQSSGSLETVLDRTAHVRKKFWQCN